MAKRYQVRECIECGQIIHESAYSGKDGNFKKHVAMHERERNDQQQGKDKQ